MPGYVLEVTKPRHAWDLARNLLPLESSNEQGLVVYLDASYKVLSAKTLAGEQCSIDFDPLTIALHAARLGSTKVVLLHSHPGRTLVLSSEDQACRSKVSYMLGMRGIKMCDFMVVTPDGYTSQYLKEPVRV